MDSLENYWSRTNVSRRAALRHAGLLGGGLAALDLLGCKGATKKPAEAGKSGPAPVLDSTKGKRGGTLKLYDSNFPPSHSIIDQNQNHRYAGLTQSTLLDFQWGVQGVSFATWDKLQSDLAVAMPEQPDTMTYIFKLRPGVKYHNGRELTADDVKYSIDRYTKDDKSLWKTTYAGFFDGLTTPDASTVLFKTKFPYLDTLQFLAGHRGEAYILSREHEEGPDASTGLVGTGPYILTQTSPPVSTFYRRNPEYFLQPYPYFDELQVFVAADQVKQLADFYSRQVHAPWFTYLADREEIAKNRPDAMHLEITPFWGQSIFMRTDKPPFNDRRFRQALSMSIDRKKLKDALNKGEGRNDQMFPLMIKTLTGTREVEELGSAAKYWEYNPAEAKKLFAAAGVNLPFKSTMTHWDQSVVGQWFPDGATLIEAGWREQGIADVQDVTQLFGVYQSTTGVGKYEGLGWSLNPDWASGIAIGLAVRDQFSWGSNGEHAASNLSYINDARLSALATKQLQTFDAEERKSVFREMEAIIAEEQHRVVTTTTSQNWFWDPSLANVSFPADIGDHRFRAKWWFK